MTALNIQAVQNETDEACMVQDMLFKKGVKYEGKEIKNITLPIEEFEKKYPVSYSIVVPGIPEGHVAKVVSVRPC